MLFSALSVSNTGVQAASQYLDVAGNNIANANTTGFKTSVVSFADLLYTLNLGPNFGPSVPGAGSPTADQLGSGTDVSAVSPVFTQGPITPTGEPFDLAINGQGLFAVTLPGGTTGYTRAGNFTTDASGQLVTPDGFILAPNIVIPADATTVSIAPDGTVTVVTPDGTQDLGQITLTTFPNPSGLLATGDDVFLSTPAAGDPVVGVPGVDVPGTITQGALEGSNIDLANELVNLIIAQNTFTFNSQALTATNVALQATIDLIP